MSISKRPGIFANVIWDTAQTANAGFSIGLVAKSDQTVWGVQKITSMAQAMAVFGEPSVDNVMGQMLSVIYENASPVVYALPPQENTVAAYTEAMETIGAIDEVYLMTTDCVYYHFCAWAKEWMISGRGERRKLLILPTPSQYEPIGVANSLDSPRICLCYPKVIYRGFLNDISGAVLCGLLAGSEDITDNLCGKMAIGAYSTMPLSDEEIETYLANGICVFERSGDELELIRGLSTELTQGEADTSRYGNISVTLILDHVLQRLSRMLRDKGIGQSNRSVTMDAIATLMDCELAEMVEEGLLNSYKPPFLQLDPEDATACLVQLAFVVRQGINRMELTAHISV